MMETRIAPTERMRTLAQLAQVVSASLDVTAVLDAIVGAAIDLLPGASARIWVAQDDGLVLRAEAGTFTAPAGRDVTRLAIGQGLTGSVAAYREPLVVADMRTDDRLISFERAREQGWVSFMGIPLLARDRLVGVLALFTRHRHGFTNEEVETLAAFGSQAALAIDDARLYAGVQARVRRLRALTRLNQLISSSLDSDALLQEIARAAAELMEAPLASFWQADEAARSVTLITSSDQTIEEAPRRTRVYGQGIIGWVAAHRLAVNIPDVFMDGRSPSLDWHRRHGFSSLFAMPVVGDGHLLAVLAINARRPLRIEDEDRDLLESFVAQAAVAIRNARLFAESERRRRTAEVLQRLSSELAQSLDLEEVGRRIVDSVRMLIDAPVATLHRIDAGSDDLIMLAGESPAGEAARRMPKDSATIGLAIRERQAVATTDVLTDSRIVLTPEARAAVARTGYGAVLAVPLVVRGRVTGALALADRPGRVFNEEESRLMQAFADHAALALANAQLVHETRVRETRLEELVETSRQLSRLQPLDTLLTRISEACGRLVNSSSVGFRLVDGDELVATGAIADSDGDMMSLPRLKIGESLSGIVAVSGEPLVVNDNAAQDPRVLPRHLANLARAGQRAWLGVPVKTGDRVAGVFSIRTRREEGFSEADVAVAKAFAAQAAVALENARLFTESEQRRREAEVFVDLARSITASLDPDMVLARVADWARELCGSDIASIALRDSDTDGFTVRHRSGAEARTSPAPLISPGRGLGGLVLVTGQPARTDDYTTDPRFQAEPQMVAGVRQDGIAAVLSVPIRSRGRIEGLLYVCNRSRRAFTDRDEAVLARLAEHAAIAIHNSRLFVREQSARAAAEESERALRDREAQLRQSQKMEAVGQLAGGVAHDFNNLLTVIAGRSELLSRRLREEDPLRRDVILIQKTVERATALTRQLLAFSRKQVLQARVVDLGPVVTGLCPMLQRLLGEDIELVIVPQPHRVGVRADIGQLEQVIVNLAVNARDAMPGGGQLVIDVCREQLAEAEAAQVGVTAGAHAVLSVTDTGVGMDKATQSRIFEPFFTTKAPGKGTGLGLSTVYGIIQQHQGAVAVQSRVGHGTTFKVYLPLTDEAPAAAVPDNFQGIPTGTETILLVEDEEEVRILAREVLEHAGYTVLEAASGPDALETAQETTRGIHLLLTDVIMPRMNGRELAERLVATWPTLKVLYMSGYTKDVLEPHDLSSGLLLHKPFTPQSLARKVRDILDEPRSKITASASGTAARTR